MGANMARRLKDCGYRIAVVQDINAEAAQALADELGCRHARNLSDVSNEAEIIFTVVSDDAAMRQLFSRNGDSLLTGDAQGRLFINCATVSPAVHVELQEACEAVGARSIEACMASSIPQARQGTLYLMIGGRKEVFDSVRGLLEDLSKELIYIGEAGRAAQVKALVNMVMNINTAALAEGLGLATALGLDLDTVMRVFSQTGANSRVLETDGDDMKNREHDCFFSAAHAAKDSGIAASLAKEAGLSLPLNDATLAQYKRLVEMGRGDLDKSAVAELTFPGRAK